MTIGWLGIIIWCIFSILSQLFLSKLFFTLRIITIIPTTFSVMILFDSFSRESVDSKKILLTTAISVLVLSNLIDQTQIYFGTFSTGENGTFIRGTLQTNYSMLTLLIGGAFAYYNLRIHFNSPRNLKFYSWISLLGAAQIAVFVPLVVVLGLERVIPGLNMLVVATGAATFTLGFVKEPKLAFILPFKALRLTIIDRSGLPYFSHTWSQSEIEERINPELFSGMLQAVSTFANESLKKGNIQEIKLARAILILHYSKDYPVMSVLFSTKSSQSLRYALESFTEKFVNEFSQYFDPPVNTKDFVTASDIVLDCFAFVPDYTS
jgi:hypothetical protein